MEDVSIDVFEKAIEEVEAKNNLAGQPRVIVFHEKDGRRHAHAVWSRIDVSEMKAVQLSHDHPKLMDVSRDLFIEHDWKMPRGMMNSKDRDPLNFSLAEWQQAKRAGKNAREIKGTIKDCWAISDSQKSFANALKEHGYILAQGRRGHVALDHQGEVFAISGATDLKAKQVRAKLGEIENLPSVSEAHQQATKLITDRLNAIRNEQKRQQRAKEERFAQERERIKQRQKAERAQVLKEQRDRQRKELSERQERLRKGVMGLWDRLIGKRKKTLEESKQEASHAMQRDAQERHVVAAKQKAAREALKHKADTARKRHQSIQSELQSDIKQLHAKAAANKDTDREAFKAKRRAADKRLKRRKSRSRDGPTMG